MRRALLVTLFAAGCSVNSANLDPTTMCTPPLCPIADVSLALEVTPPAQQDVNAPAVTRIELAEVMLDANGNVAVQLPEPVVISGHVTVGHQTQQTLSGAVIATRPSRIPGRPDESFQTVLDGNGDYRLWVTEPLPGEIYTLRVVASDTTLYPPQTFQPDVSLINSIVRVIGFDLTLDDPAELTQVKGKLTDAVGQPIPGMQVQATDPNNKTVVSTTTITDANGSYTIRLSKKLSGQVVTLTLAPTMAAAAGTPTLRLPVDLSMVVNKVVSVNLQLPPLPAATKVSYHLAGMGPSGAEMPAVGAQVKFATVLDDPNPNLPPATLKVTYETTAETDVDGVASLFVIPARPGTPTRSYNVTVSTAAKSDFQSTAFSLDVGPNGGWGADIPLKLRPQLSGRIVDTLGLAVRGLTVQPGPASVTTSTTSTSLADLTQTDTTTTNADGRFAMRIDPGTYDVALLPAAASQLPRKWLERKTIAGDVDVGQVPVPSPAMASIAVLDSKGNPLPNATLQLFVVADANRDPSCVATAGCLSPPRLAAEGMCDGNGQVLVVLPSTNTRGASF